MGGDGTFRCRPPARTGKVSLKYTESQTIATARCSISTRRSGCRRSCGRSVAADRPFGDDAAWPQVATGNAQGDQVKSETSISGFLGGVLDGGTEDIYYRGRPVHPIRFSMRSPTCGQ